MADEVQTTTAQNVSGDGQQPAAPQKTERTYSETEFERILGERLQRERDKFKDYADLQKAAAQYKKLQDAQLSEAEQLKAKVAELEAAKTKAEALAQDRLVKAAFIAAASQASALHPGDAYALADHSKIKVGEDGEVTGVAEIVAELVKAGRLPVKGPAPAPPLDGGQGDGKRPNEQAVDLDEAELRRQAVNLGVNPDQYVEYHKARLARAARK